MLIAILVVSSESEAPFRLISITNMNSVSL